MLMTEMSNGKGFGPPNNKGVVTAADVHRWRQDQETIAAQVKELSAQYAALGRKLEAAAILFPDLETTEPFELRTPTSDDQQSSPPSEGESLGDEIARVLREANRPLAPIEIRAALVKNGKELSQNYLYTAIKRAADRQKIKRYGKRYRAPRTSSPQGETGGMAPPAS